MSPPAGQFAVVHLLSFDMKHDNLDLLHLTGQRPFSTCRSVPAKNEEAIGTFDLDITLHRNTTLRLFLR